ncbi:MAG: poly-gamma-glutamate synthase PgsB [Calditrichaeota bacterium]|nr:poly-gamma-glutamate synthase PgsB [Calditrichota bacterium]
MLVLLLILVSLCCYGAIEYYGHQQRLRQIPLRIHINGTRGKSSVTRLIAAGLRAGGFKTMAKTTGTLPRIIDIDGKEIPIIRDQRANIIEQVKIFKYFERRKPQAVVVECMAVLPEYQWICERQLIRSHIGVITNARLDHINEMGHFREQITRSLSNTMPVKEIYSGPYIKEGKPLPPVLFTSEKQNFPIMKEVAEEQGVEIYRVGGKGVTVDELRRFGHIEHPANVGLALAVCAWVGIDRQTALEGMYRSAPDAGALKIARCIHNDKELLFVNAMAANDPESTLEIYHQIANRFAPLGSLLMLLNSRADRQDRSIQLIEMTAANVNFDYFVLTGESLHRFMTYIPRYNIPKEKTVGLGWITPEKVYEKLFNLIERRGTVLAIGNVGAGGLEIFRYFYKHRRQEA